MVGLDEVRIKALRRTLSTANPAGTLTMSVRIVTEMLDQIEDLQSAVQETYDDAFDSGVSFAVETGAAA